MGVVIEICVKYPGGPTWMNDTEVLDGRCRYYKRYVTDGIAANTCIIMY
jgi:hypothetical protein